MKVQIASQHIIDACDKALKMIEDERASEDKNTLARFESYETGFWFWRKTITRTEADQKHIARKRALYPSKVYEDSRIRLRQLKSLAEHKLMLGYLDVMEPHLWEISTFLAPTESKRI